MFPPNDKLYFFKKLNMSYKYLLCSRRQVSLGDRLTHKYDKARRTPPSTVGGLFALLGQLRNSKRGTGLFKCSETWVGLTLIRVFHHLAQLHSHFC